MSRPFPSYWLYRDAQRLWRWRYDASNGKTIAVSSESYNRKGDCERAIEIMKASYNAPIWGPVDDINQPS